MLAALSLLAVFAHVALEWLFFATKPSFLSALGWREKLLLPGSASLPLLAAALALLAALYGLTASRGAGAVERAGRAVARAVPALVLAATLLLLADNFTHTVFGWGTASLRGATRGLTLLLFAVVALVLHGRLGRWEVALAGRRRRRRALYAAALAVGLYAVVAAALESTGPTPRAAGAPGPGRTGKRALPNVLLIGGDGVNAEHLSLYGYRRPTTPFLERLAAESLVCENAFPNASTTGGSTVSILTSRLPTETGVIYPPDIARTEAAYRHLPALLKQLGYRTGQFTTRWYADAVDLNLQGSFDWANARATAAPQLDLVRERLGQASAYFLGLMGERLAERLLFARPRPDPFREMMADRLPVHLDGQRIVSLLRFIDAERRPFFAHVHLLGTHGPRFAPRELRFAAGQQQRAAWMPDFYDDAIADFDRDLDRVVEHLRRRGLLDETVLAVYSDHGQLYSTADRLPLLFRFPGGAHAGRLSANVQNLDIAPTLLDAVGFAPPPWMEGTSLLRGEPDPCRPILSAIHNADILTKQGNWWYSVPRPPFYTLGAVAVLAGDRYFSLDLTSGRLADRPVRRSGLVAGCAGAAEEERAILARHLAANGYDVSSLGAVPGVPLRASLPLPRHP